MTLGAPSLVPLAEPTRNLSTASMSRTPITSRQWLFSFRTSLLLSFLMPMMTGWRLRSRTLSRLICLNVPVTSPVHSSTAHVFLKRRDPLSCGSCCPQPVSSISLFPTPYHFFRRRWYCKPSTRPLPRIGYGRHTSHTCYSLSLGFGEQADTTPATPNRSSGEVSVLPVNRPSNVGSEAHFRSR